MKIYVVAGKGYGRTNLSAFDAALKDAGIHNYNLIYLSSIIPPGARVIRKKKYEAPVGEYGHRLYIVKAEIRTEETGKAIAAGLGWYQSREDGRGVFVEHEIKAETVKTAREELEFKIKNSLKDLCEFRNFPYKESDFEMTISACKIKDQPGCALVAAVYPSEGWTPKNQAPL